MNGLSDCHAVLWIRRPDRHFPLSTMPFVTWDDAYLDGCG
jgi:hypothetical protein